MEGKGTLVYACIWNVYSVKVGLMIYLSEEFDL